LPEINFSVIHNAQWAPGIETAQAWLEWANAKREIAGQSEPGVKAMPAMLRRRCGLLGKMALEVAYAGIGDQHTIPTVFCSRYGEISRSVELLSNLAQQQLLSPTAFGLSVHNAIAGLFSIARKDHANHIALAAGQSRVEYALIEASGLLADGAPQVLLVVYHAPVPSLYTHFQEDDNHPLAWAWLISTPTNQPTFSLTWAALDADFDNTLLRGHDTDILRFYLRKDAVLERYDEQHHFWWRYAA
jgi:hypothetical protein